MWIFLNDAFFSIVQPHDRELAKDHLLVRARIQGDIQKVFPRAKVETTPARDYRFRATVRRDDVKIAMQGEVQRIDYTNFKDSVDDDDRHDAYADVWTTMFRYGNSKAPRSFGQNVIPFIEGNTYQGNLPAGTVTPPKIVHAKQPRKIKRKGKQLKVGI